MDEIVDLKREIKDLREQFIVSKNSFDKQLSSLSQTVEQLTDAFNDHCFGGD